MIKKQLALFWNKMSLKKKINTIILSVGLLMMVGIGVNVQFIYVFIDDVKLLMDDNLSSYKFQEALEVETDTFLEFMRNPSEDTERKINEAAKITKRRLKQLPYDYAQIGEARYEITWNIQNSYDVYQQQRDRVMVLTEEQPDYIEELYKTYQMQEYLHDYASRLVHEVLDGGNIYYEERVNALRRMPYFIGAGSLLALAIFYVFTKMLTRDIVSVLSSLVRVSKSIGKNDFSSEDVVWEVPDEIGQLVHAFNKMKHATENHVHTMEEKRTIEEKLYQQDLEKANLEQRFAEAQLQLIKSQLNPHFLFNTLNMITRMTQIEGAQVSQEMLEAMSNLLRYSLRTTAAFTPLNQELKIIEDYMYIQEKRFGERISWKVNCEVHDKLIEVPVFLLQPLVENAVIHGISMKEEGGHIEVRVSRDKEWLYISVEDNGLGMSKEKLEQIRIAIRQRTRGIGIGLGNIYRRITAYYEQGEVSVDSIENKGTRISIMLGKRKDTDNTVKEGAEYNVSDINSRR